jgi:hypothetical protein
MQTFGDFLKENLSQYQGNGLSSRFDKDSVIRCHNNVFSRSQKIIYG